MAGRSVGSIEVTVDADTGKLVSQLRKAGRVGGEAAAKEIDDALDDIDGKVSIGVDEASLRRVEEQVEESLDDLLASVGVRVDEGDLVRAEEHIEESLDDLLASVGIRIEEGDLARVEEQVEESLDNLMATLGLRVDEDDLARVEQRIEGSLDDLLASVGVRVQEGDLGRVREEVAETLDDLLAKVGVSLDDIEAQRVEAELETRFLKELDAVIGVDLQGQEAFLAAQRLKREVEEILDDIKGKVNVSPDMATVVATEAIVQENLDDIKAKVEVGYDKTSKAATDAALVSNFKQTGTKAGEGFGDSAGRGLSTRMKAIIAGIVVLAEPAGVALQGVLAASTSVLSSAFSALGGAAGALVPVLAAVGGAVATLIIGFQGMGGALKAVSSEFAASLAEGRAFNSNSEEIREAMRSLAPAARQVVEAFAGLQPQFTAIRQVVQQNLFQGLGQSLASLGRDVIPQVGAGLAGLAREFNSFFKGLAADARGIDFGAIFAALQPVLERVLTGFRALFRAIEPLIKAAAPAAQELADSFKKGAESLEDMIRAGQQSGKLTQFFLEGVTSLREWGRLLKATGDALFTLFEAGKSSGDGFVVSLTKIITKFDDWMESAKGQTALKEFFDTGKAAMSALVPVLEGLQGFFDNIVSEGAISRFAELGENVGRVLPVLGQLLEIVGRTQILNTFIELLAIIGDALQPAIPALQALADAIGHSVGDAVRAAEPLIRALGIAIQGIAAFLEPIAPLIVGVAVAFGAWKVLTSVVGMIKAVQTAMVALGTTVGTTNLVLAGIAVAAGLAFMAFQSLGDKEREIAARAEEVSDALVTQFNTLLDTATAANAASLGVDALADSLTSAGGDGEKLTKALGTLGFTTDDALDVMTSFKENTDEAAVALAKMAQDSGIAGDRAKELGAFVASTDKVIGHGSTLYGERGNAVRGVTDAERNLIDAMEELEDQIGKTDLDLMIQDFLAAEAATSDAAQATLDLAEDNTNLERTGKNLIPLYAEFTRLMGLDAAATNAAAGETAGMTEEQEAAARASEAFAQQIEGQLGGLGNLGDEAGQTATDVADLKESFKDLEDALGDIDITKVFSDAGAAAARFEGLKRAMEETADAAGEMKSAFDLLVGTQLSVQEATSNFEQDIDDLAAVLKDMTEEGEGAVAFGGQLADTFDLTGEAGRNVAEAIRKGVEDIGAWGEAQLAAGKGAEETAAGMKSMREGLIDAASQFFASREEAEKFVTTILGLDDTKIDTTVSVAGMQKALDDLTEFDRDLDGIPDTKDMTFNAPTIETIRAKAAELGVDISKIPDDVVVEFFATKLRESLEDVEILGGDLDDIDGKHPEATVTVRNEASKVLDPVAVSLGNFEGFYDATLVLDDKATEEIDEAQIAAGNFDGFIGTAVLDADATKAKTQLEVASLAGVSWDTSDYSATIGIVDEASQVLTDTSAAGEAFGLLTPSATIGVVDEFTTPMTAAMDQAGAFGLLAPSADLSITDNVTAPIGAAKTAVQEFDAMFGFADIGVNDNATGPTNAAKTSVQELDAMFGFAEIGVTGADTAKTGVEDVDTALTNVDGKSAETNVSLVNNFIVILQLGAIMLGLKEVSDFHAKPKVTLPDYAKVVSQLAALGTMMFSLDRMTADPRITLPTWFTAISQVGALSSAIRNIPDGSANITVTGVEGAISRVNALDAAIDRLQSKTITVTTRNVTTGGNMTGAIVPGSATGELIRSPTMRLVGERGYDEAIIPLQLPLNRIDPSVRDLAALLRGEGLKGLKPGPTKIINQYMTVNTVVQDPVAVATQVINRSAMLAHN